VFAVSEGAAVYRRNEVLAETGGAVSALTPEVAHCVTSIQVLATGGGKVRQHRAPFNQKETRMSVVDMVILVLKLIVAVLQLLDAVLKYVR
jgi:small toxic protein TisB